MTAPAFDATKKESTDKNASAPAKNDNVNKANNSTAGPVKVKKSPAIDAAARRLERLLGGGQTQTSSSSTSNLVLLSLSNMNPSKIVRRWLGTSSGTSGKATLSEITSAASRLLDPKGVSAAGLDLLTALKLGLTVGVKPEEEDKDMEVETSPADEVNEAEADEEDDFLVVSSCEVEAWLLSLAVRLLWRNKNFTTAFQLATESIAIISSHIDTSRATIGASASDTSALFPLLARMHRYRALVAESLPDVSIRDDMVHAHSLACLRRDVDSQATLLNSILRDLLCSHQVEQAQKLLANSTFPENASHNQLCRYLYHSGLIHALRLDYTSSFSSLSQSLRKSHVNTGLGFRIATQRLLIVVQLLMGEIPERKIFFDNTMKVELEPYLKITQAVRRGDLAVFHSTVSTYAARLKLDGTYTLISRLAHSVVKAGLRRLNLSYSRISLVDIAKRLSLPSVASAEYVVAKAVRDGVIDATISHSEGYVRSHENVDIYITKEPAEAFHRRIAYCLTTHNDAVKGMRYPPDQYKKDLEKSRGRGKDEEKTEEEMAKELEDELDEDY